MLAGDRRWRLPFSDYASQQAALRYAVKIATVSLTYPNPIC